MTIGLWMNREAEPAVKQIDAQVRFKRLTGPIADITRLLLLNRGGHVVGSAELTIVPAKWVSLPRMLFRNSFLSVPFLWILPTAEI
jgi:hypothetical protein